MRTEIPLRPSRRPLARAAEAIADALDRIGGSGEERLRFALARALDALRRYRAGECAVAELEAEIEGVILAAGEVGR